MKMTITVHASRQSIILSSQSNAKRWLFVAITIKPILKRLVLVFVCMCMVLTLCISVGAKDILPRCFLTQLLGHNLPRR